MSAGLPSDQPSHQAGRLPIIAALCLAAYVLLVSLLQADLVTALILALYAGLCGYVLVGPVATLLKAELLANSYPYLLSIVLLPLWFLWVITIAWKHEPERALIAGAAGAIVAAAVLVLCRTLNKAYINAQLDGTGKLYGEYAGEDRRRMNRAIKCSVMTFIACVWLAHSTLDLWFTSPSLHLTAGPLQRARGAEAPWRNIQVGLALSGGGYRAALMHAGVLKALDEHRVPVTHLSTVSGGSIIGAFYALGGEPEEFRQAMIEGRLSLRRSLTNFYNVVRLPFPAQVPYTPVRLLPMYQFDRADAQAALLDTVLLDAKQLKDLDSSSRPRLQLCATDLRDGLAVGIARDDIILRRMPWRDWPEGGDAPGATNLEVETRRPGAAGNERIARLVAASGAFPGAFNPLHVELMEMPVSPTERQELLLTDGGVSDNSGISLLLDRHHAALSNQTDGWRIDLLIASDGGKPLQPIEEVWGIDTVSRAIDIIHAGSGWHGTAEMGSNDQSPRMVMLRPLDLDRDRRELTTFRNTSTLTDSFSPDQAEDLFTLGKMLVEHHWPRIESFLDEAASKRVQ